MILLIHSARGSLLVALQMSYNETLPYDHPVNTITLLLWPLYSDLTKSSVSQFVIYRTPFLLHGHPSLLM